MLHDGLNRKVLTTPGWVNQEFISEDRAVFN